MGDISLSNADMFSTSETLTNKIWTDGKKVYRKIIEFGALPNATSKLVAHGITGLDKFLPSCSCQADLIAGTTQIPIPLSWGFGDNIYSFTDTDVSIFCSGDNTGFEGFFILEYTKT